MKITVQDAGYLNWDKIAERVREDILIEAGWVLHEVAAAVKLLKPGQRKTFVIKVGTITISCPKDLEAK